jgi:hypothetical protein
VLGTVVAQFVNVFEARRLWRRCTTYRTRRSIVVGGGLLSTIVCHVVN